MPDFSNILANYLTLRSKVDAQCRLAAAHLGDSMVCRKGCDSCCRHISVFPVEALAINSALRSASPAVSEQISRLAANATENRCPLLEEGNCLLYEARPIICRTHGYPLLATLNGENSLDFCPLNFTGVTNFPSDTILNMDLLNTTLAAINSVFCASASMSLIFHKERLTIAEALLLEL
jgi:uncharacterized protein